MDVILASKVLLPQQILKKLLMSVYPLFIICLEKDIVFSPVR